MPITISGSGTITGLTTGGLPDGSIAAGDLADNAVTAGKLATTLDLTGKTVTLPSGTGGKILQVLQDTKTDTFSTTNNIANSVEITGLSQAITMTDASNKVLVMANISVSGSSNSEAAISLFRGSTHIYLGDGGNGPNVGPPCGMLWSSGSWQGNSANMVFLDTPGTGSHTYTVRIGGNGTSTIFVNRTGRNGTSDPLSPSSITLMEVAA